MTRALIILSLTLAACGPNPQGGDDSGCTPECTINGWRACVGGQLQAPEVCTGGQVCVDGLGCADCVPNDTYCDGNDVRQCNADGTAGAVLDTCTGTQVCGGGSCVSACEQAQIQRSNMGCEYFAVDLDNEYSQFNDAAGEQFAVVLANPSSYTVNVTVEQNDAAPGATPQLSTVTTATILPNNLTQINLARREVDGSVQGHDEGSGTMLSSRAYRVTTDFPVVAYQFNPIVQDFSNGASLLIPTSGLDTDYDVVGWPTANPISIGPSIPGIPDHSFVTIVGTSATPVHVTVKLGGPIVAGGGIPSAGTGGTVEAELSAFDVMNLESNGIPGDLTGTQVQADGNVVVFTGGERAIVPGNVAPPPPAGYDPSNLCCTEHFEQQEFPLSSLGKNFVTTRSPVRSGNPSNPEGDVWRVLSTEPGTEVTTNLPAPFDHFSLGENEVKEFWSTTDFVLSSNNPIIVAQYLVSQGYVESPTVGGDPEFILYPPAEQYRNDYIFLTPTTFQTNYCVIAAPVDATVTLDSQQVTETDARCQRYDAGTLQGVDYVAIRCTLQPGVHQVVGSVPVGVTVYGYYNVGSYGYAAGSQLTRINVP